MWGLILAAMTVFIIRLTYLSYGTENYYSQIIELDSRSFDELEFPTVTICNIKPVYKVREDSAFNVDLWTSNVQIFSPFYSLRLRMAM